MKSSLDNLVVQKFGDYTERINFSKIKRHLPVPHLISIQLDSFEWLITNGIEQIFAETFPINNEKNNIILNVSKWWIEKPTRTEAEAKAQSRNYDVSVRAEINLTFYQRVEIPKLVDTATSIKSYLQGKLTSGALILQTTDQNYFTVNLSNKRSRKFKLLVRLLEEKDNNIRVEIKLVQTAKVFVCHLPKMTQRGTFIINGLEKVVISQIVRSPGVYYKQLGHHAGARGFGCDFIAARGSWLDVYSEPKVTADKVQILLYAKINKSRRFSLVFLLLTLGFEVDVVRELFASHPIVDATLNAANLTGNFQADYERAMHDLNRTVNVAGGILGPNNAEAFFSNLFFSEDWYELKPAGRYKLNAKLSLLQRVTGCTLATDIKHNKTKRTLMRAGTVLTGTNLTRLDRILHAQHCDYQLQSHFLNQGLTVQRLAVWAKDAPERTATATPIIVIGNDPTTTAKHLLVGDIIAGISYLLNLHEGLGTEDDIDHLSNRRVRLVGELVQNQLKIGLNRMKKNWQTQFRLFNLESIVKQSVSFIFNSKPLISLVGEFFNLSPLCQFMDQTNPLSGLASKRIVTASGPGGLSKDKIGIEVRDVNTSYYGRFCPIQTPEGPHIGLINNFSIYARVNDLGFIETPYFRVQQGVVTTQCDYLDAKAEEQEYIAQANTLTDARGKIVEIEVVARHQGENLMVTPDLVTYIDVSPRQLVAVATGCIPFLENDDANRALMGANMLRQGIPLINPEAPIVGTGLEHVVAKDSREVVIAKQAGIVSYADGKRIVVKTPGASHTYQLNNFLRSNQGTLIHHTPLVRTGARVKVHQVIADGSGISHAELALGRNVLVAFATWKGYNFEDAIVISERLITDDEFTSVHINEYKLECRRTKQGDEEITRELVNVTDIARQNLDDQGLVLVGTEVRPGDILVGKITPLGQVNLSPEDRLLNVIFGAKAKKVKDNSLRVPNGGAGTVIGVSRFNQKQADLAADVLSIVKVYVAQKRKIQVGDKMAGRHGNKGVVSIIAPVEDMPHTTDGTPIDIVLNPLGVPSRMNIGQVLEMHLGQALATRGIKGCVPIFEGLSDVELQSFMEQSGISDFGKQTLIDGRTGAHIDHKIAVGVMYMMKLSHMVDDKIHSRATGPYSLITQQPLGGKAQNGGQRFGEMEVWALEAYGASRTLQEMLTIKSDDIKGRENAYQAIIWDRKINKPAVPESFNVLINEIKGLGFDFRLTNPTTTVAKANIKRAYQTFRVDNLATTPPPRRVISDQDVDQAIAKQLLGDPRHG